MRLSFYKRRHETAIGFNPLGDIDYHLFLRASMYIALGVKGRLSKMLGGNKPAHGICIFY